MDAGLDARKITIHRPEDFAGMRVAGRLAAETLDMIAPHVRPGVATATLDRLCHDFILAHGAVPAPLNYRGFPKSICTSINHVVCHGIPGDRRLEDGRHAEHRHHRGAGRLARRFQPDVLRRPAFDQGAPPDRRDLRGAAARGARGPPGRHARRHRPRDPDVRGVRTASRWCATSAATASAGASTRRRTCCISAAPATDRNSGPACSSPSSRWSTPAARR